MALAMREERTTEAEGAEVQEATTTSQEGPKIHDSKIENTSAQVEEVTESNMKRLANNKTIKSRPRKRAMFKEAAEAVTVVATEAITIAEAEAATTKIVTKATVKELSIETGNYT